MTMQDFLRARQHFGAEDLFSHPLIEYVDIGSRIRLFFARGNDCALCW
jgi:hypothetical protein